MNAPTILENGGKNSTFFFESGCTCKKQLDADALKQLKRLE